jgi:tight adherence protein B
MGLLGILSLLVLTMTLGLWGMWTLQRGRAERDALTDRTELGFSERQSSRLHASIDNVLRRTTPGKALRRRLSLAGINLTVLDTVLLTAIGATAVGVAVSTFFGRVTGLLAAVVFLAGANAWLTNQQLRRQDQFIGQLPEVARVMSNALSAGLAMPSALRMVATEVPDPARTEFRHAVDAMRVGHSPEAALEELADRLPSREVGVLVTTLAVQQRAGGDLVNALRHISETLEARKALREELKTETSGSVASSYIVVGVVVITFVLLNIVSPGIVEKLTSTLIGRVVVVVSLLLYTAGFIIIRRITRIEV